MNLTNELKSIRENTLVEGEYTRAARITEKYNYFVERGFIQEEGRKVPSPGEVNNNYASAQSAQYCIFGVAEDTQQS